MHRSIAEHRRRRQARPAWLVLALLWIVPTSTAVAQSAPVPGQPPHEANAPGFLLGDHYRYGHSPVLLRIFCDVVAIPADVVHWDETDWATLAGVSGVGLGLMWPMDPPFDVWLNRRVTPETDKWLPEIWNTPFQAALWGGIAVGGLGTWEWARLAGHDDLAEGMSLMAESLAVTQFYHLSLKLTLGRDGSGDFQGPPDSFDFFPAGTPSGHFATLYSLYGAAEAYWQPSWKIRVPAHILLALMALTHVLNHRHYLSEVWWGGALGYTVGHWVVHHRQSRHHLEGGQDVQISVTPLPRGIALQVSF